MESNSRNRLLYFIEQSRIEASKLDRLNNESPVYSREQNERIYRYKQVLDQLEEYLQRSNENQSLDMTNFDKVANEVSKEWKSLAETEKLIQSHNAETMILDKVLVAENEYLIDKKKEGKYFSYIEKISNTSRQLDNRITNILSGCLNQKYSRNFTHTGEKLNDNYDSIDLDKTNKDKKKEILGEYNTLGKKCFDFRKEKKSVQQEERFNELFQLIDGVNRELISFDYSNDYLHQLNKLSDQLNMQKNGEIGLEDVQKQRDQLIWEMEQFKENIVKVKNDYLVSETIANVNKTKEQVAKMKEMGSDVELIDRYSQYTNAHLDNLQNTAEQMHYLNKEELLQEIGNIKTENQDFQKEVKQQRNQEQ